MLKYKLDIDLDTTDVKKFEWAGEIICDGIIVPKLSIFSDNKSC
jgi:hypothetical protein